MVYHKGQVYVIGGFDGSGRTDTVEKINLKTASQTEPWESVAPLLKGLIDHCAVSIEGSIYVVGGKGNSTLQAYTQASRKWTFKSVMPCDTDNVAATAYKGQIFVLGGTPPVTLKYVPGTDSWEKLVPPSSVHAGSKAVAMGNSIFVLGGWNTANITHDENRIDSVMEYKPQDDSWSQCNYKLWQTLSSHAAVVASIPQS